ncbi:alpha/beta fold hydrolase [Aeromicrobium ginsengisoli]|uniref:Alpha/beta hydrolase n=1 Tax=Aeromicrobium ginsengisoli TaxID=363867 RepID=A0A5M4FKF8_9ACTN|nr:alpha/beta hydrolase [Aeromicrobium ginsengisoli]KAA1400075.1 alpha/beta hydrolase [Aeromicrobium ginsengisoli]
MPQLTSADGTTIAYDRVGAGPPMVLVDGAMCLRGAGPMDALAERLADRFTIFTYDRRGRGESTDTPPYAVEREVEDLSALIDAAGGEACVYAMSSGGALALATAAAGARITGLALYEPPYVAEAEGDAVSADYTARLDELLAAGDRGGAITLFMTRVGVPPQVIDGMRAGPGWARFEAIAPTLAYDNRLLNGSRVPRELAARITTRTVVLSGGASPDSLHQAARATATALPNAEHQILEGQTHDVAPDALAPALVDFFG